MYETNVGAGLPVINTLNGLINSGDKIMSIEGVLSGSLSFIFNNFTKCKKFSDVVLQAKELGFTEPDPRIDLNFTDVKRKLIILAREIGLGIEDGDVAIDYFLTEECMNAPDVNAFHSELQNADPYFEKRRSDAAGEGKVLRVVASLKNGIASIGVKQVGSDHAFYSLSGSDNIIVFTSERYKERPLIVRGPGAGAEVTAAGVFSEIITIGHYIT